MRKWIAWVAQGGQNSRVRSRDERAIWSDLRATRYAPPGDADSHRERRATYVAGLQQAEELFRAASGSGPASSPLLLFYGLSQAGRAIAAAAVGQRADDWRLSGHGIKAQPLNADLPDIKVVAQPNDGKASYVRLSRIVGSPIWSGAGSPLLFRLWDAIPEMINHPLRAKEERRVPLLAIPNSSLDGHQMVSAQVSGFPRYLAGGNASRADFDTFMASYPSAHGYIPVIDQTDKPQYHDYSDIDGLSVQMGWEAGPTYPVPEEIRVARLNAVVRPYTRGSFYLFPATVAGAEPLHPLMTWWAVLYTLSMLARYQPAEWARWIDINHSEYANAVEHLLGEAQNVVPEIILTTLSIVTT